MKWSRQHPLWEVAVCDRVYGKSAFFLYLYHLAYFFTLWRRSINQGGEPEDNEDNDNDIEANNNIENDGPDAPR